MASVRVDEKARTDWRFTALGRACGRDRRWALGAMIDVWSHCTEEQTYVLSKAALDTIGDADGFAEAVLRAELGELLTDGTIRIRGTAGRIEWLGQRREAGRTGGQASAKQRASKRQANTNPLALALSPDLASYEASKSALARVPSPLDMPKAEGPGPQQTLPGTNESPSASSENIDTALTAVAVLKARARVEAALYVEWFNRTFGSGFTVRGEVVESVRWLLEDGHTQGSMRLVARAKKAEWEGDEKMRDQLKPSVLLRRKAFGERLDAARVKHPTWSDGSTRLDGASLGDRVHDGARAHPEWWDRVMPDIGKALRVLGIPLPEPRLLALPGGRTS